MKLSAGIPSGWRVSAHSRTTPEPSDFGLGLIALVGVLGTAIAASTVTNSSAFELILAVAVVATVATSVLVYAHCEEHDAFSPLGLICLFYIATFAIGAIYFYVARWPLGLQPYAQSDLAPAVALAAIGLIMLTLGYRVNPLRALLGVFPALPADETSRRTIVFIATLLVVGWFARAYSITTGHYFYSDVEAGPTTGASWLVLTGTSLPLLAAAYCGARYYFARRTSANYGSARWQYYLLLAIEIAYYTPTARRTAILNILMLILVLRYYGLRRRPSVTALFATVTVAVVVVFPVLNTFRNTHTTIAYHDDLLGNLVLATKSLTESSPKQAVNTGLEATFQRFSGVTSVAAILHYGPHSLDRRPGETLSWAYTSFLPRVIAPNKPNPGHFGNEFAQKFAIAGPGPVATSVTVPQVAELYLNYRLIGIILGMFVVGAIYRLMGDYLVGRRSDALALAVYATVAWTLINSQEAIIAGGVLGIIKLTAVLIVAMLGASRLQRFWARPA